MSFEGTIHLSLIHGFELRARERIVRVPPSTQRLVAFVALKNRSMRRNYVAGSLWLDSCSRRANANLRSALWRLQKEGLEILECDATHIALRADVDVDLLRSERAAATVLDGGDVTDFAECEPAWRGDLLPDWYDDWLLLERERYRQLRLHAMESLCVHYAQTGSFGRAIDVGLAVVEAEPLRETAHRRLIEAHLAEGNLHEARRQLRWCRALFRTELGIEPSASLSELCQRLM